MSEREGPWPSNGDLRELARESSEHRRAWALVGALSSRLVTERKSKPPSTEAQNKRIVNLEATIVKQRKALAHLEDCRAFERETEHKLAEALEKISTIRTSDAARTRAIAALHELAHRKGPRPQEADAPA